jgi:hypothetical protein
MAAAMGRRTRKAMVVAEEAATNKLRHRTPEERRSSVGRSARDKNPRHKPWGVYLYNSQNTKWSELGFSAVLGSGVSEVRFERTTLS